MAKEIYEITPEQKEEIEMLQDNFKEFLDGNLSENLTQIQVLAQMAEWSVFHLYLHASIRAKLTANYVRKVFKYNGKEAPELPINFETIASVAMGRALKSA